MVAPRFFAAEAERTGDLVALPDEEARHLTRVLRLETGARVRVFNGRGAEFDATVEEAGPRGVTVRLDVAREPVREAATRLTLVQAVLKGDKMDEVVRDAVMIGVAALQPVVTSRSEVTLATLARGHRRERWERIAVASAKQCGRAVVPPVAEPVALHAYLRDRRVEPGSPAWLLAEPGVAGTVTGLEGVLAAVPPTADLLVGPEGGWASEEVAAACGAGWHLLSLGDRTIRADAMALVAVSALFARWGEF